jgi:hypothetical protein
MKVKILIEIDQQTSFLIDTVMDYIPCEIVKKSEHSKVQVSRKPELRVKKKIYRGQKYTK